MSLFRDLLIEKKRKPYYCEVEYLEGTGTQYIDTGIIPTGAYTVIAKAKYNDLGSGSSKLFGSRNGSSSKEFIFTAGSLNGAVFTIGYGTNTITATGIDSDTNIHIFKLSKGTGYVDNAIAKQFPQESFTGDYPIYLFGANYAGTENGLSSTRFYYEEIYDGNDVLVQNLIPCRRNSDSVLGMYDTVTGNFLTNAGTGTFTAGSDVVPTPDAPMDIYCNNGVIKVSPNLFTRDGETLGKFYDASGVEQDGAYPGYYFAHTDFIKVKPNTTYTFGLKAGYATVSGGSLNHRVIGWTSSKSYVKEEINVIEPPNTEAGTLLYGTFTTSATTEYVTINFLYAPLETEIQLVQGSNLPATYRPYGQIYVDSNSKNLFDYEYFYDNYQTYSPSAVGRCPIKLQPNTTYTVSTNKDTGMYTSSMFVVSGSAIDWTASTSNNGILVNSPRTVTTDSNGYLCFGLYVASENAIPESDFINGTVWVQIEQGSSATPYVPYHNTTETVEVTGKNLFDKSIFTGDSDLNLIYTSYQIPNGTYTMSSPDFPFTGSTTNVFFLAGNISTGASTPINGVAINKPITITVTDGYYTIAHRYISGRDLNNAHPVDYNWQIEQGSTATSYKPYFNGGSATAEMLLKVGDYKDEQSVIDGGVTRNIGIKVLDGSEDWKATYQGFFEAPLPNHIASVPAYCNYFQSVTTGTVPPVAERANKVWLGSTWVGLGATTKFSTVNTFKQWLADQYANGTPCIIVYPLAEPTTETVTGQPLDIPEDYVLTVTGSLDDLVATVGKSIHTTPTPKQPLDIRCNNGVLKVNNQGQIYTDGTVETVEIDTTGNTANAEMLLAVGSYQDVQSVLDGNVTRNIGIEVLDGTENWTYSADCFRLVISDTFAFPNTCLCSHYKGVISDLIVSQMNDNEIKCGYEGTGTQNTIYLKDARFTTTNALTAFLADQYAQGTPVTILYPTSSPVTEQVISQPLSIQEGTNIITAEGSIDNLPLEVSYKAGVAVTITEVQNAQLDNNVEVTING